MQFSRTNLFTFIFYYDFDPTSTWDLNFWMRDEPMPLQWELQSLTQHDHQTSPTFCYFLI